MWSRLKTSEGVIVTPQCLHDKYDKPEGLLLLALDRSGAQYAVSRFAYQKDRPVEEQVRDATFSALQALWDEGVPVLGFLPAGEACCTNCVARLREQHPELAELAELVELAPVRHFKEEWMAVVSRDAELRALAEPVVKLVDVMASTPLYASTMAMAARANKIE